MDIYTFEKIKINKQKNKEREGQKYMGLKLVSKPEVCCQNILTKDVFDIRNSAYRHVFLNKWINRGFSKNEIGLLIDKIVAAEGSVSPVKTLNNDITSTWRGWLLLWIACWNKFNS